MIAPKTTRHKAKWAFPENLKLIRESLNLGQRAFAERLEVTQQTVSLWERGKRKPGKRTWILLEQKLGYTRSELEIGPLPVLPYAGVSESRAYAHSISLPPPKKGTPIMRLGQSGLAAESLTLAQAQRLLREAVREGRPIWLVLG